MYPVSLMQYVDETVWRCGLCTPVALGFKGSEWGSKLGCQDSEIQYLGKKVWGCGLGSFDLVGSNGHCQHVGLGRRNGTY